MNVHRVQAPVSTQSTFAVECPSCHQSKIFTPADLPPNFQNSFDYVCPCGAVLPIAPNYRKSHRRRVNLAGSFTPRSATKQVSVLFDVLDLSATGMQIATEGTARIANGQRLDATVILDDKQRTKLLLPCLVRRKTSREKRLLLGLEFENVTLYQQQVLGSYLMA